MSSGSEDDWDGFDEDESDFSDSDSGSKKKAKAKPPPKPKAKAAEPVKKKAKVGNSDEEHPASKPLAVSNTNGSPKTHKKKTIEETYQKLDHIEHALKRPDMYIGSAQMVEATMWVYDEPGGMTLRKINYVPGLYKIFDEILVNAADNKQRDPNMKSIRVEIKGDTISVANDGEGLPVVMHQKENIYVPELVFGTLLTGTNFDDTSQKVVGGRNGLGAKLANIFSKEFIVETIDSNRELSFRQVFNDNMGKRTKPEIKATTKGSSTRIVFQPDLARFHMTELDNDIVALMRKRVYDVAGCNPSLKVYFNGELIPIRNFQQYCEMYLPAAAEGEKKEIFYEKVSDRWEVCFSPSTTAEFMQVSFVNSICTTQGGTHVSEVTKPIVKAIEEKVKKANRSTPVTSAQVKNHIWVFIRALINNPSFNSQTKEQLTTQAKDFGSKCELSEKFLGSIVKKSTVIDTLLLFAKSKESKALAKAAGPKRNRLTGMSKLDDANEAGSKRAEDCTLILTEGDSAKALAVSGLGVVGRDYYGVFPLRGKVMNVRGAKLGTVLKNEEIQNIIKILGLQPGKAYDSVKGLRYGHVMIMADQDHDGSHIKGLLLNLLHFYWPTLLKLPGFVNEFITPIVKAKRGSTEKAFYTLPEFQEWLKRIQENGEKGWKFKYYKGLGTSTAAEAKEYFSRIERHQVEFDWDDSRDANEIIKAFDPKKADERKQWMESYQPGTFLDHSDGTVQISDFINRELILHSIDNCERTIPSMVDGLKPVQRKVIYCCFKRKLKQEIKVAQLAGYVSEHSAYHHGEASLQQAIIKLAQNYVGSNNINLLYPSGQFGTRLQGGADAASPRYIFTRLAKITRFIFREEDDPLLTYLEDDGFPIEPKWYIPVIPMCLVNGADGIGTGYSTTIPNYNPLDIINNVRALINDEKTTPMHPWYRDFKGTITPEYNLPKASSKKKTKTTSTSEDGDKKEDGEHKEDEDNHASIFNVDDDVEDLTVGENTAVSITSSDQVKAYRFRGLYHKIDENTLEITELPIGRWTQDQKVKLEKLIELNIVNSFKEHHTDTTVHFIIEFCEGKLQELELKGKLEATLGLSSSVNITNEHLFDADSKIHKYDNIEQIMQEFYDLRFDYYQKRKQHMLDKLAQEKSRLDNKVRFIQMVVKDELIVRNKKKEALLKELQQKGFSKFDVKETTAAKVKKAKREDSDEEEDRLEGNEEDEVEDDEDKDEISDKNTGYDYLLSMPLWSLTVERMEKLKAEAARKNSELETLRATAPKQLWLRDLDDLEKALMEWYEEEDRLAQKAGSIKRKNYKGKTKTVKKQPSFKSNSTSSSSSSLSVKVDTKSKPMQSSLISSFPSVKTTASSSINTAKTSSSSNVKPKSETVKPESTIVKSSTSSATTSMGSAIAKSKDVFDLDSDEEIGMSLTERLEKRISLSPQKPLSSFSSGFSATTSIKPSVKRPASDDDDSDSPKVKKQKSIPKKIIDSDEEVKEVKKPAAVKKRAIVDSDSDEKPKTKKKSESKAKPKKKSKKVIDSDEEEEEDYSKASESEDEVIESSIVQGRSKRETAKKVINYAIDADDDEDDGDDYDDVE